MPAANANNPTLIGLANMLMSNAPQTSAPQPALPNVAAPLHYNPQGMTPYGMTAMGMVGPWWQAAQRQFTYTPQRGLTMPNTAPGNFTSSGGTGGSTGTGQPNGLGGNPVPGGPFGPPVPLPGGGTFHGNPSGGDIGQKYLPGPGHNQHIKPVQPPISPNQQGTSFGGGFDPNSPFAPGFVGSLADPTTGNPGGGSFANSAAPAYTANIGGVHGADVLGPPKNPVYINGNQVAGTGDQNNTAPVAGALINPTTGEYDPRGWEPVPGQQLGTTPGTVPIRYRPRGG